MSEKFTTEQLTDRWEDQRDIKNLMGKYINLTLQNRDAEIFGMLWSGEADVCLGLNDGWYVGLSAVNGYYNAVHDRNVLIADLLQKKFPEKIGDKTADEIFGIGTFRVYPIVSPIIQIAEDGKTAKGLWYAQGSQAIVGPARPTSHWTWGYFAADFIREDDTWKIWHLQFTNDVDARCGYDWGKPAEPMEELPEFAPLKDFAMPAYSVKATVRPYYSPDRPLTGVPRLPEEYKTFAGTFSYGI
ncbi:MAG: nuclear transport factor 2 family protein [Oscillospiraceae bacterium]|nr:nuclear transport factor 2 family protein [Oscillospiraceae bacterium]